GSAKACPGLPEEHGQASGGLPLSKRAVRERSYGCTDGDATQAGTAGAQDGPIARPLGRREGCSRIIGFSLKARRTGGFREQAGASEAAVADCARPTSARATIDLRNPELPRASAEWRQFAQPNSFASCKTGLTIHRMRYRIQSSIQ